MNYKYKVTRMDDSSCVISASAIYKPSNKPFVKLYKDDSIVEADKNTIGLMTFKTKRQAKYFIREYGSRTKWKIKRVVPLCRGETPKYIGLAVSIFDFYFNKDKGRLIQSDMYDPPDGTICYHKLKVVGDC